MTDLLPRAVLERDRDAIRATLAAHGVTEAGVFGSVAPHEDTGRSDLDLIVTFSPGARRDLVRLTDELAKLTGLSVDVVDQVMDRARRTGIGYSILRDTVPL